MHFNYTFAFRPQDSPWFIIRGKMKQDVFSPNVGFYNTLSTEKQSEYGARSTEYFFLYYPHHFEYRETLIVEAYCTFLFEKFPFDTHHCELEIGNDIFDINSLLLVSRQNQK